MKRFIGYFAIMGALAVGKVIAQDNTDVSTPASDNTTAQDTTNQNTGESGTDAPNADSGTPAPSTDAIAPTEPDASPSTTNAAEETTDGTAPALPTATPSKDTKTYPGAHCQPERSRDAGAAQSDSTGLYNASAWKTIKVTCPVVRDSERKDDDTPIESAEIRVSNPGDQELRCTLLSRGEFGAIPRRSMWKSDWLDFSADTVLDVTIGATLPDATYSITCTLPPKARIYGYQIVE